MKWPPWGNISLQVRLGQPSQNRERRRPLMKWVKWLGTLCTILAYDRLVYPCELVITLLLLCIKLLHQCWQNCMLEPYPSATNVTSITKDRVKGCIARIAIEMGIPLAFVDCQLDKPPKLPVIEWAKPIIVVASLGISKGSAQELGTRLLIVMEEHLWSLQERLSRNHQHISIHFQTTISKPQNFH